MSKEIGYWKNDRNNLWNLKVNLELLHVTPPKKPKSDVEAEYSYFPFLGSPFSGYIDPFSFFKLPHGLSLHFLTLIF